VALSGARLTWVPIEVTLHTQLTRDGLRRLEQARSQVGAMLAAMVRDWSERGFRHRTHGQPDAVANMHDALAMASLLPEAPSWLTLEPATLAYAVDAGGTFTTTAVAATHGHNGDNGNAGHSARVATRVDAAAFERFYLDCVLAAFG
jgi:inosine-uridine nucleoside N-ribohydrolase